MGITIKNQQQLEGIRKAGRIVAEVHNTIGERIQPGMTTRAVELIAKNIVLARGGKSATLGYGGQPNPYPGFVCVSVNDEVVHGIASDRFLFDGDIVSVDIVVELNGYFADATMSYAIGTISQRDEELMEGTKLALSAGIAAAVEGNRVQDISEAVSKVAKQFGLGVVRDLVGHGVGLKMHEDPQIPNYVSRGPSPRLRNGMVIAIEPMLTTGSWRVETANDGWTVKTFDGSNAAHFEHTVAINPGGPQIMTRL